jgi:hypothetical protein
MEQKNIKDLSVIELKAMVYDHLGNIELSKQTINVINQEIASRQKVENGTDRKV